MMKFGIEQARNSLTSCSDRRYSLGVHVSAFIQLEDNTLKLILDILCKIYRGKGSLCNQFWEGESFVDGPIRCLLCNLEVEFSIRTEELVDFLSALCEGTWPANCVYNFLYKSVGISSLLEIISDSLVDNISQIIETRLSLLLWWTLETPCMFKQLA